MDSGIYQIINTENSKTYIGSSKHLNKRHYEHLYLLRNNRHNNKRLQNSFNKYGEDRFTFRVLLLCEEFELERYENYLIEKLSPLFNIEKAYKRKVGGWSPSIESRKKMSESRKRHSGPNKGKRLKREQVAILSAVNKGNQNASKSRFVNLISPTGDHIEGFITNMAKFCRENGICSNGTFIGFLNGNKSSYKEWRIVE